MTSSEHKQLDALWEAYRDAIDAAYAESLQPGSTSRAGNLRDYARNISMEDKLESLVEHEMQHERRHRGYDRVTGFAVRQAARLMILHNTATHRAFDAIDSLTIRDTAFETSVIAGLVLPFLSPEWIAAAEQLDYAELMTRHRKADR